jgi:hypothetical protein
VSSLPHFQIRIISPICCELRNEGDGWTRDFHSVKGALDFLGDLSAVVVTLTNESSGGEMKVVLPGQPTLPRPERRSVMHIE